VQAPLVNASFGGDLPRVTVVTVVLNAAGVIERTLNSVFAQDYPNMEYVVIDGQSTDGTLEILKAHRDKIDKLVSESDGGIYEAMNKAVAMATGQWILFMNARDLFVGTDAIARAFSSCNWSECDVIYGDGIFCHEGRRAIECAPDRITLLNGNGFSHQSTFVRTALQREYGFDVTERIAADYDLFLRLFKAGKVFRHVDVVISEFFTGGFSTRPPLETIRLRHRVYKKHLPRTDLILYLRLADRAARIACRAIVPSRAWEALKRFRDRGKMLSDDGGQRNQPQDDVERRFARKI
jgi:glycosyltransferase involved in cell wall biosynthesis